MINDLTGRMFGKLLVLARTNASGKTGHAWWACQCECGKICKYPSSSLISYNSRSCGNPGCRKHQHILDIRRAEGQFRNDRRIFNGVKLGMIRGAYGPSGPNKNTKTFLANFDFEGTRLVFREMRGILSRIKI